MVFTFLFILLLCEGGRAAVRLSASLALSGQGVDAGDLVVRGGAGPHRVGMGRIGPVEVGAAGDDQPVLFAQLPALGLVGLAVAGVVDLDAVQLALTTSCRTSGILLETVGWAKTKTALAARAVAITSSTGGYSGECSTMPRGFHPKR